jgi:preprotein translocase subunit YajC
VNQQIISMAPLLLIFVVMYFVIIRPQNRKAKEHQNMISALGKGDRIVTNGGVIGTITDLQEKELSIEISPGVIMQVSRAMVATKIEEPAKAKKAAAPKKAPAKVNKSVKK